MNFAFFGSSLVSAYWNGAATYYRGMVRGLHRRGHSITFFEPDAFERQRHRDLDDPDWARVVVYPASKAALDRALAAAAGADVIVKTSGVGVFDDYLEQAVADLKKPANTVIFWDVDAPATLDRMAGDPYDPLRALIPRYDLILTYGGGEPVVRAYLALGAPLCVPIYNALDLSTHHPVAAEPRFAADLAFLGNRLPDREERVDEFFFKAAAARPRYNFLLGGNGWGDRPMPANINALGHVYTRDHNAINATARAVLNISRSSMARYGFSPATRVFEAAGAAACLITDAWEGIELFLEPEREVLVATDGEQVAAILDDLSPARARRIGRNALDRVTGAHTYAHRAAQLEAVLEGRQHRPGKEA